MKNKLLLFIMLISWIMPTFSSAQCVISKEILDDGAIGYSGQNIRIYRNEDLENGLQVAYIQMIALQKAENSTFLKFSTRISVGSSGSKSTISPHDVKFEFSDGRVLEFNTENVSTKNIKGITVYEGLFQITMDEFKIFQTVNLSMIKIIDSGNNTGIISHPDGRAVLQQSNCIIDSISN